MALNDALMEFDELCSQQDGSAVICHTALQVPDTLSHY